MALVACALSACATAPPQGADPVRFGVIGDQTGVDDLARAYRVLEQGVAALNAHRPELVLHTGDLLESAQAPNAVQRDWTEATAILDRLEAPWYLTPGDHDVNPPERVTGSADRSREALFQTLYGARNPAAAEQPFYSFDHRGVRFISLYSHETLHADPRWGLTFQARISERQRQWLDEALTATPLPRATVVFVHQPLWYNWAAWAPIHALLAENGVDLVVAGHFHYGQDEGALDGVRYIVVGATGGMTKTGSPNAGDRHHVTVIEVGADDLDIQVVPLSPEAEPAVLPARHNMDRVQAVSSMLWSAMGRGAVADGACLGVPLLGNPIDLPLTLSVLNSGPAADGRFADDLCAGRAQPCQLPPGRGVMSSNLSSVVLAPRTNAAWVASDHLAREITVVAEFDSAGQTFRLEHQMTLAQVACAQ